VYRAAPYTRLAETSLRGCALAVLAARFLPCSMATPAQAIILAAGRGERLRPLTDHTPKPLLHVGRYRLIEWHLLALARSGIGDVVINTAWLEEQLPAVLGQGDRYGLRIHWSHEGRDHGGALETAGGIAKALPLLAEAFWVVSGDVFVPDMVFDAQPHRCLGQPGAALGCLWMVPNAAHHPDGDFGWVSEGLPMRACPPRLTWASVGVMSRPLFDGLPAGQPMRLRPVLDAALTQNRLIGRMLPGRWVDVGTPERLDLARSMAGAPAA
jgi:N-acetyl-alpha-D-muramate 1-phosphate uridylyltransferase